MVDKRRWRYLNQRKIGTGKVIYWMSRDIRVEDNWAMIMASDLADSLRSDVEIVFVRVKKFLEARREIFEQLEKAISGVAASAAKRRIKLRVIEGEPAEVIKKLCKDEKIAAIVTDFSPLRIGREWREDVAAEIAIPLYEVDAHNIVPAWIVSDKQEYGAYTIRPKLLRVLPEYLVEYPKEWKSLGNRELKDFAGRVVLFEDKRNDPNAEATSRLSSQLHFGQLSAARVALTIDNAVYLEELIVRRELAENYCLHNANYDNPKGFPAWARETLHEHEKDEREFLYSRDEFEEARTHDKLWNSAQKQMLTTGYMHGFMRMYWAKKILEWSESATQAQATAIYLNNKYEIDGRDPNGYAGIAWSIGGVHDRPWFERPIFGKIRYMNESGCRRKFAVERYIKKWLTN